MEDTISNFGDNIWNSSRDYVLKTGSIERTRQFAAMTSMTVLRKSLETDEVIFLEGIPTRSFNQPQLLCGNSGFGRQLIGEIMQNKNRGYEDLTEDK